MAKGLAESMAMKNLISRLIAKKLNISCGEVSLLHARGGFVTGRTSIEALQDLIFQLHPKMDPAVPLVRLGPLGDGGYLVPDDLKYISSCFSPGVSSISGFEKMCADRGMDVYLTDKSVEQPAEFHDKFHFQKMHVGSLTNHETITLDDWVNASVPNDESDLLLQMDIEGAEYETLLRASDSLLKRFRVMVIEFHRLQQLWDKNFFSTASRTFEKILQTHYCVHIHPNNYAGTIDFHGLEIPDLMELTFIRKDRLQTPQYAKAFPHPLDCDNTSACSLPLPLCWYGGSVNKQNHHEC
jgi:hypothetical protein